MDNVIAIRRDKALVQKKAPTFQVAVKHIHNPHKFQFFFNYGKSAVGPWLCVGVNKTIYGFGYLPRARKK